MDLICADVILMIASYLITYDDQLHMRLTCSWFDEVLSGKYPIYSGPYGKCLICGIKPRCSKHAKKKTKFINSIMRYPPRGRNRMRGGLSRGHGRRELRIEGTPNMSVKVNWKKHLLCGCVYHPYCRDVDILHQHTLICQHHTRFCKMCGIPINWCKHKELPLKRTQIPYKSDMEPIQLQQIGI